MIKKMNAWNGMVGEWRHDKHNEMKGKEREKDAMFGWEGGTTSVGVVTDFE